MDKNKKRKLLITQVYECLNSGQRKEAIIAIVLILINSILDVISLGSIIPLIILITNPEIINSNFYLNYLFKILNFTSQNSFLIFFAIGLIILFMLKNIINALISRYIIRFTYRVESNIAEDNFKSFYNIPYLSFSNSSFSEITTNIQNTPTLFASSILLASINLIGDFVILLGITIGLMIYNASLLLLLGFILGPILIIFYLIKNGSINKIKEDIKNTPIQSFKYLSQGVQGYIDIKIYQKENFFIKKFIYFKKKLHKKYIILYLIRIASEKTLELTAIFALITIFIYSIVMKKNAEQTISLISLFAAATYRLIPSINKIINNLTNIKTYAYTMEYIQKNTIVESSTNLNNFISFHKHIKFSNICFSYPHATKPTLQNINLEIKKGEIIGLVGRSGSGKTTLLKLLLRFLKEDSGQLYIDDMHLTDYHTLSWRKHIGYVSQNPVLLNATIAENIALGEEEIDYKKISTCISSCELLGLIESLPHGVKANIGERGAKLSGGQIQRIAIARALYRDADILVLDESTSALDLKTEEEIIKTLSNLNKEGKTIIIITHRASTLKVCHNTYEINNGILEKINIL